MFPILLKVNNRVKCTKIDTSAMLLILSISFPAAYSVHFISCDCGSMVALSSPIDSLGGIKGKFALTNLYQNFARKHEDNIHMKHIKQQVSFKA